MTKNALIHAKKIFFYPHFNTPWKHLWENPTLKQPVDNFFKFSTKNIVIDSMEMSNFTA